MSDIKWIQCPEATHYRPYEGMYRWYRERNGTFAYLNECGDWEASQVDADSLRQTLICKAPESAWIKCSDRLPDEHQDCLVYYHEPSINFPNLHFMTESSFYNGRFEIPQEVSHWQPLPAPPTD